MAKPNRCCCVVLLLSCLMASATAACPYAAQASKAKAIDLPTGHPKVAATSSRKLLRSRTTMMASYAAAIQALVTDFERVVGKCQFSIEGMQYANNDATILVNSAGVFFPAASWLRAFFHDAGTFIKNPAQGGPKGGPNGSIGVGCETNNCGRQGTAIPVASNATCPNGDPAVSGFSTGLSYCCPGAHECLAHGQSSNSGPTPGLTVPVCLNGSQATVELCRRENDNLLPTIQFYRGRQNNPNFQWGTPKKPLSFADILVVGAAVVANKCSGSALNISITFGREDSDVADDSMLPGTTTFLEDKHITVFQQMGLNKIDMVTMVTGSHAIGGFRALSSPTLTSCPFVPFDCTAAGQTSPTPFDNNVYKVACDGVQGVSKGVCEWNQKCTNPMVDETPQGCPFTGSARAAFAACNATAYPQPGLVSDVFLCQQPETRQRMVEYALDQDFFFSKYTAGFDKLANLGFKQSELFTLGASAK